MNPYKIGVSVKVINNKLQSYGLIGTIIEMPENKQKYINSVAIYFENWHGEPNKIKIISKENIQIFENFKKDTGGNNMKVIGNYIVAKVVFLQGRNTITPYSFALFDKDISVGDMVLCDTQNGYVVGKIQCLIPKEDYVGTTVTKEIICKVDFSEFEKRKENRKKKETLKKHMNEMVKENQELVLFQMLAEKNPEMKALLDEYNNIVI